MASLAGYLNCAGPDSPHASGRPLALAWRLSSVRGQLVELATGFVFLQTAGRPLHDHVFSLKSTLIT
ncbi:hypothetical protein, partial [Streptomyces sp. NPDC001978]|uniref:hypothetical protein n=1 Tax=Streptomyces sp. NPDC001978 TaxID=3364627 RepID=UPI003682683E